MFKFLMVLATAGSIFFIDTDYIAGYLLLVTFILLCFKMYNDEQGEM